ncbi:MAG: rhodanese-like domain-containing protein [Paracoccaceae bacterium]
MKKLALTIAFAVTAGAAMAEVEVGITADMPSVIVQTANGPVEISRIQDTANEVDGEWALTSRACPAFCIQPNTPAEGVTTIAELELIEMLQDPQAVVVDSRTPDWFSDGTIPGAINIPFDVAIDNLGQLGCEPDFDGWDCTAATKVALFCNGLWCGQSPTAIRFMIGAGYPAERIFYYRGGMQTWRLLGLTVTGGE